MKRFFKWAIVGFSGLLVLAIAFGAVAYFLALRTVQPLEGRIDLAGLKDQVTVTRDKDGVPHILAGDEFDAATALGFAHAQDRLWQMEMLRMTGQGRLSEMFGKNDNVQDIDVFLRTLGFSEQVDASFPILSANAREILEAYARGVNAFLNREKRMLEPGLPPEFLILGHSPEPWKPQHSMIVLKIMALQLSMNMDREMKRLMLAARGLSPAEIEDILPYHRDENPPPLPDLREIVRLKSPDETAQADRPDAFASLRDDWFNTGKWASNNWVLSGEKTRSGKPLLANDPHLSFGAPSLWYLAHVQWRDGKGGQKNLIGATIPAVPAIVLGRNDSIAWGFTNAGADVQDLFVERIKPDDADSYFTPSGWRKFETRQEVIKIKGAADLVFKRQVGRHGPILPKSYKDHGRFLGKNLRLALQWTGLSKQDRSFEIVSSLANASTVGEFGNSIRKIVSPMQAIVVADAKGSIGFFAKARVPVRGAANTMRGRAPGLGWTRDYDWQGIVPVDELPQSINPANGSIGTANSRFISSNDGPFLTHDWDEPFRHDRVQQTMVRTNSMLGVDDMIRGQNDSYSPALADLRDTMLSIMEARPNQQRLIDRLKAWDGHMTRDRSEPLIMMAFFRHALEVILKDDLGPVFDAAHTAPAVSLLRILKQGGARDWCDRQKTQVIESCGSMLAEAFDKAVSELTKKYGSSPDAWRWGNAHPVWNEHQPFAKQWPLSLVFNIERPASGGAYTLLRGKPKLANKTEPYRAVHGAGYRAIYDFSDLNNSLYVQSTGQSGNALSSRYDDQADIWAAGKYLKMTTDPADYAKDALGTWTLDPAAAEPSQNSQTE